MGKGRFSTDPSLASFFVEQSRQSDEAACLPARNFLLDEGVSADRAGTYASSVSSTVGSAADWYRAHEDYLYAEVFLSRPVNEPPRTVNPTNAKVCPQTFRELASFEVFGRADRRLHLLRVLDAHPIAMKAGCSVDQLIEAARVVQESSAQGSGPPVDERRLVETALAVWNRECDLRPSFVSFYLDHEDLFGASPGEDRDGWADELRDRLGLSHLDPHASGTRHVLVFRYEVAEVPKHRDLPSRERPLATPTVLDGRLNPAFCPAPREAQSGHTIHLQANGDRPCREVLHPYFDLQLEHLFRAGELRRPVSATLEPARRAHLVILRRDYDRDDYARATDPA